VADAPLAYAAEPAPATKRYAKSSGNDDASALPNIPTDVINGP